MPCASRLGGGSPPGGGSRRSRGAPPRCGRTWAGRSAAAPVTQLVEPVGGQRAELAHRLAHGGQAGAHVAGGHDVVPADDGDVVGHGARRRPAAGHDRQGELVVGADERVGVEARRRGSGRRRPCRRSRGTRTRTGSAAARPRARVGGDEAVVAVADVGGGVGVTDEEQPACGRGSSRCAVSCRALSMFSARSPRCPARCRRR